MIAIIVPKKENVTAGVTAGEGSDVVVKSL